jgi:hypothetical protein
VTWTTVVCQSQVARPAHPAADHRSRGSRGSAVPAWLTAPVPSVVTTEHHFDPIFLTLRVRVLQWFPIPRQDQNPLPDRHYHQFVGTTPLRSCKARVKTMRPVVERDAANKRRLRQCQQCRIRRARDIDRRGKRGRRLPYCVAKPLRRGLVAGTILSQVPTWIICDHACDWSG